MSTKTTKDGSLQSTKQMLDELDALMEKMLSLPVNDPEDASPFPKEVVKPPVLTPTVSATLTLLEPPLSTSPPLAEPKAAPAHPATNPPHMSMPMSLPIEPAPQPEPLTNEVTPPSLLPKLEPLLADIPDAEPALTTQWVYLPLLWVNHCFDGVAVLFGGAWFQTQVGRMVLGVSGIALFLAAAAWCLKDWLGWN